MQSYHILVVVFVMAQVCSSQRPFYAGFRPIGYPKVVDQVNGLENRFGEDDQLPVLARGDRNLVNRLARLPEDKQPYWYLNWRQHEEFLKNPKTWTPNGNSFTWNK